MTINGYRFTYEDALQMYECRGAVCHNEYGDEVPEENLWKAAQQLAWELGTQWEPQHSEKGWVEVMKIPTIEDTLKLVKDQEADEEEETSECCGRTMNPDSDLCPECLEHTGQ